MSQAEIRAFICCESELAYQALKLTLSSIECVRIVGYSTDGLSGVEQILRTKPDIALLAARLTLLDTPEVIKQIRHQHPETRLVVVAQAGEDEEVAAAIESGADAFCYEPAFATLELLSAIHSALAARRNQRANGSANGTTKA